MIPRFSWFSSVFAVMASQPDFASLLVTVLGAAVILAWNHSGTPPSQQVPGFRLLVSLAMPASYAFYVRRHLSRLFSIFYLPRHLPKNGNLLHAFVAEEVPAPAIPQLSSFTPTSPTFSADMSMLHLMGPPPLRLRDFWVRKLTRVGVQPAHSALGAVLAVAVLALVLQKFSRVQILLIFGPFMGEFFPWFFRFVVDGWVDGPNSFPCVRHLPAARDIAFALILCLSFLSTVFIAEDALAFCPDHWFSCRLQGAASALCIFYAALRAAPMHSAIALVPRGQSGLPSERLPAGSHLLIAEDAAVASALEHNLRQASVNGVVGVSVRALQELRQLMRRRLVPAHGDNFTTKVVVEEVIRPCTSSGQAQYGGVSLYDACRASINEGVHLGMDERGEPLVWRPSPNDFGPATAFLSHAWGCVFDNTIETLGCHEKEWSTRGSTFTFFLPILPSWILTLPALHDCDARVWVDLVFKNQHQPFILPGFPGAVVYAQETEEQFERNIGGPGVVWVMALGTQDVRWPPLPLQRIWCLYEILAAQRNSCHLEIVLSSIALSPGWTGWMAILSDFLPPWVISHLQGTAADLISLQASTENAQAQDPADRIRIQGILLRQHGTFAAADTEIKRAMLGAFLQRLLALQHIATSVHGIAFFVGSAASFLFGAVGFFFAWRFFDSLRCYFYSSECTRPPFLGFVMFFFLPSLIALFLGAASLLVLERWTFVSMRAATSNLLITVAAAQDALSVGGVGAAQVGGVGAAQVGGAGAAQVGGAGHV